MLNKDDKNYITGEISGSIKKSEKSLKYYIHEAIKKSETRLEGKIRNNGLMIENLQDLVYRIAENQDITNKKLDRLERRFDKSGIDNFPILWEEVKKHAKRISILEVKTN